MQKLVGLLGAVIFTAAALFYSYSLHRSFINRLDVLSENPTITGKESQNLIRKLRRYASLSIMEDDVPTVVLVTHPESVPIFHGLTEQGDVIFLYPKTQKAYLFDPRSRISYEISVKLTPMQ